MAPECYESNGKLTEKVDIWAVGCILNEIFGGSLPFEECTQIQQIVKKLLVDKKGPLVPRHILPQMRMLIQQCLHFNILDRVGAPEIFDKLMNKGGTKYAAVEGSAEGCTLSSIELMVVYSLGSIFAV